MPSNDNKTDSVMVTVHCTVYNHELYLRQCLNGIVMQQTNFKFEVIVHDDVSTDNSVFIINEYAKKYPNIIIPIIEKENQYSKHNGSLNKIMNKYTHGKYIALCEGDDYWIDPTKLQKQYDYMEKHPECSLCGTNGLVLTENGKNRPRYFNHDFISRTIELKEVIGHWHFPTCSLMYRKTVTENYPDWTNTIYSGDQTLILIAGTKGQIFSFNDITCVYRKMPDNPYSLTNFTAKNKLFEIEEHIKLYHNFLAYAPNYKYDIKKHLKNLHLQKKYIMKKSTSILLPYIFMPIYTWKKLIKTDIPHWIKKVLQKKGLDLIKQNNY